MKTAEKYCRACGAPIDSKRGRADRLYCDEGCKNRYHNSRSADENAELRRIELILRRNHRVLKKMFLRKDRDEISRERLLKAGFDFDFHTHHVTTKVKGYEYVFCFGYGYRPIGDAASQFKVIKAFEYREDDEGR